MRHGRPLLPNSWGLLSSSVGYPDCNNQLHSQNMDPKVWCAWDRTWHIVGAQQIFVQWLELSRWLVSQEWNQNGGPWDRGAAGAKRLASIRESERRIRRRGCRKLHRAVCSGRGGCFWDTLFPCVAAKSGSFPFPFCSNSPPASRTPGEHSLQSPPVPRFLGGEGGEGRRCAGPVPRPAPGRRLWWLRWRCARPSPEGRGPRAAQAGPARAGVGRLGQGEDGRGAPGREQRGCQEIGRRPLRRCRLQVSPRGAPIAPTPPPLRFRTRKCSRDSTGWLEGKLTPASMPAAPACQHSPGHPTLL